MPETPREEATEKLQGPNANQSQLGAAAGPSQSHLHDSKRDGNGSKGDKTGRGETLREKAAKKFQGPDANPSQLDDPIDLRAETSDDTGSRQILEAMRGRQS
ncbi:uncharacterized protein F4812DRAFT_443114 [Daldinia caldariorum]|uniref:uncharacterized protein n=1 Tax=Daldinia caldariorum TaxID=326644 RepID=UPI002007F216|nr:uncharacterized protein F4812DRAFT_443114 [Daldinia caldariorum]KAI1464364.1 hypothetical protein F4812DRAFT_443114 [Daldinia caldariorum]